MYSNGQTYNPNQKPCLGALLNPHLSINQGLVHNAPFNEGSGGQVFDLSANGNTGTLAGSAPWEAGKFGPAPHYDGSSGRHKIAYSPELYCGNYMTVSFWAKSDISNYTTDAYPFGMWDSGNGKRMWSVRIEADTDVWQIITAQADQDNALTATTLSVDTNWHYFAFVVDNANKKWHFYVDGIFRETLTMIYSFIDMGSSLTIGAVDDNSNWLDFFV